MHHADHYRRLSRPFVALARAVDDAAIPANPAQPGGSRVALADRVGRDQSKAATRLEQRKRTAEEMRGEVRVAVGLRMNQLQPVEVACRVALSDRVLAGEGRIADDHVETAPPEDFGEFEFPMKGRDALSCGAHARFLWISSSASRSVMFSIARLRSAPLASRSFSRGFGFDDEKNAAANTSPASTGIDQVFVGFA